MICLVFTRCFQCPRRFPHGMSFVLEPYRFRVTDIRFLDVFAIAEMFQYVVTLTDFGERCYLSAILEPRICLLQTLQHLVRLQVGHSMNGFVAGILGVFEAVRFHEGLYLAPCAFVARLTFRWIKGFQPIFIQIEMECFSTICHGISLTHKGIEGRSCGRRQGSRWHRCHPRRRRAT